MVDVDLGRPGLKLAFAQLLYEAAESCDILLFCWFQQRYAVLQRYEAAKSCDIQEFHQALQHSEASESRDGSNFCEAQQRYEAVGRCDILEYCSATKPSSADIRSSSITKPPRAAISFNRI